ncbi:MAG TPA: hypothetical protein VGI43_16295 [Mucilaginibacter sp.]|jgi:hypothetical protein
MKKLFTVCIIAAVFQFAPAGTQAHPGVAAKPISIGFQNEESNLCIHKKDIKRCGSRACNKKLSRLNIKKGHQSRYYFT